MNLVLKELDMNLGFRKSQIFMLVLKSKRFVHQSGMYRHGK